MFDGFGQLAQVASTDEVAKAIDRVVLALDRISERLDTIIYMLKEDEENEIYNC